MSLLFAQGKNSIGNKFTGARGTVHFKAVPGRRKTEDREAATAIGTMVEGLVEK